MWLVDILKNVLLPFCFACLLSYVIEPFVEFNQRLLHQKGRVLAVFVTLLDITVVFGVIVYFCTPLVLSEINDMENMVRSFSARQVTIPLLPESLSDQISRRLNLQELLAQIESGKGLGWLDKGETLLSNTLEVVMHSLEWLITFIYVIFILLDYNRLSNGFQYLVPEKYRPAVMQVARDIKDNMNLYFRSQMLIACCAAIFYSIGFSIVGLPMAILMGLTVGILYMIPYFQYVTLIPVALICLIMSLDGSVDFWEMMGKCLLVYVVSQCICDYVLTPKIMGKTLGLNPAIILLSLSVWGTLLGIIGMIIALPLTALLIAYYKKVFIEHIPLSAPTPMADSTPSRPQR